MKIISIQPKNQMNSFKGRAPYTYITKEEALKNIENYVTKGMLENRPLKDKTLHSVNVEKERAIVNGSQKISDLDAFLKEKGVTYCQAVNNVINLAFGKDNGFYRVATVLQLNDNQAKEYVLRSMINEQESAFGGLINYKDLVSRLKRQDIIQKGIKVHTYELNNNLSLDVRKFAAKNLAIATKQKLGVDDVFFINSDVFYYDKLDKTVYSINVELPSEYAKPKLRTCTFQTNADGQVVGYKTKEWDIYAQNYVEKQYLEQQEPSAKLPSVVNTENNKELAEAFRFGNANKDTRLSRAIPIVLKHLSEKAKIDTIESKLQLIKFLNKDDRIIRRIGYYNPKTGNSLVYNDEGKYMYQLEYNKDSFGNITSSTKL
jgi:hypothetical protein